MTIGNLQEKVYGAYPVFLLQQSDMDSIAWGSGVRIADKFPHTASGKTYLTRYFLNTRDTGREYRIELIDQSDGNNYLKEGIKVQNLKPARNRIEKGDIPC